MPLSVSALQTARVPVEVFPSFPHREKQDQEAQWTRAREENQRMVRRNLDILEKELLASFGRISEDLDTRKYLRELSRPEAKSQSRFGGCLRRLRSKLMGRRKEREDHERFKRSGPEVKALLRMVRRNGSNADLHAEEQEKWDSDVDGLSEGCRKCREQMTESLQELLSTLHGNQGSKAERKPSTQSFVSDHHRQMGSLLQHNVDHVKKNKVIIIQ